MKALGYFLEDIRVEHTLFALPFAYAGAVLAARGIPPAATLLWIGVAVIAARTAAMAANRLLDSRLDALNPRTARRPTASGRLSPLVMLAAVIFGLAFLAVAAFELNPLCVRLLPLAAAGLLAYPLCKRYTWGSHFVLGAVDGLAPLGAFIAVAGTVTLPALLLFTAVTVWVAGFDVVYAMMDYDFDRGNALRSIPARFGERSARSSLTILHGTMIALLGAIGVAAKAPPLYYSGPLVALGLLAYERLQLAKAPNLVLLNERTFSMNMLFSVVFLATTLAGFTLG